MTKEEFKREYPKISELLKTTGEGTGTVPAEVIYRAIDVVHGIEEAP